MNKPSDLNRGNDFPGVNETPQELTMRRLREIKQAAELRKARKGECDSESLRTKVKSAFMPKSPRQRIRSEAERIRKNRSTEENKRIKEAFDERFNREFVPLKDTEIQTPEIKELASQNGEKLVSVLEEIAKLKSIQLEIREKFSDYLKRNVFKNKRRVNNVKVVNLSPIANQKYFYKKKVA